MMLCGMGAAITTDIIVAQYPHHDNVSYFIVELQNPTCQLYAIHKKEVAPSELVASFIGKLKKVASTQSTE